MKLFLISIIFYFNQQQTEKYARENLVFHHYSFMKSSAGYYIKCIMLTDFNEGIKKHFEYISIYDEVFEDTGKGNDVVEGDGTYTSNSLYKIEKESKVCIPITMRIICSREFSKLTGCYEHFKLKYKNMEWVPESCLLGMRKAVLNIDLSGTSIRSGL